MKDKTDKQMVSTLASSEQNIASEEPITVHPDQAYPNSNLDVPVDGITLEASVQNHIGRKLRAHYGSLVNEKVPDQFLDLLEELARKDLDQKKDTNS
jgi:hypothetical protein